MAVILAAAIALLEVGNTLLENSSDGMRRTFTSTFTGDWTVSAQGRESFTLFGSDLPLIGEYFVLPTIPDASAQMARLRRQPGVVGVAGQVTAGGLLSLEGWSLTVPVFGVDFNDYFSLFSDLKLIKGSLSAGSGRILINETQLAAMTKTLGREPRLGEALTLSIFNDASFTIWPVTLAGVYRYPAHDSTLDRIVLTDPDTARSLNGYVYGSPAGAGTSVGIAKDDIDSLFDQVQDQTAFASGGVSQSEIEERLKDTTSRDTANRALDGSWNFLLVRGDQPAQMPQGLMVRDWKNSAGGTALIVWLIQVVFNVGMGFVLIGAAVIGINSLALSVSERTKELGTMRALGAGRFRVSALVGIEVLMTVTGSAVIGVALGAAALSVLAIRGVPLTNPYIQALFGGDLLKPHASLSAAVGHIGLALALGLISSIQPIRLVLRVGPVQAMARGS